MIILGIDTSSSMCGLALSEAVSDTIKPVAQVGLNIPNAHSEKIMSLLDCLLNAAGMDRKRIEAIAVSIGPGSFTGLRIGLSTAKGLAFGLSVPIVSVPTLDIIAKKVDFLEKTIHIATSSRKDEFYYSSYAHGQRISDYSVVTTTELVDKIKPDTALISDNAGLIVDKMSEKIRQRILVMNKVFAYPDAFYVTTLGYHKILNRQIESMREMVPMYLQGFRGSKV